MIFIEFDDTFKYVRDDSCWIPDMFVMPHPDTSRYVMLVVWKSYSLLAGGKTEPIARRIAASRAGSWNELDVVSMTLKKHVAGNEYLSTDSLLVTLGTTLPIGMNCPVCRFVHDNTT